MAKMTLLDTKTIMTGLKMKILIYGVTGQDGYYLATQLLNQGHTVFGVSRRVSTDNTQRLKNVYSGKGSNILCHNNFHLLEGDINDQLSCFKIIRKVIPDRLYNLAAQSHVGTSFGQPDLTLQTTGVSAINLMNLYFEICPKGRFYQASSSEMFGNRVTRSGGQQYQSEDTPFNPQSPYAIAKASAHYHCRNLRDQGYFACAGILFNHESSLRGDNFVTKKITNYVDGLKKCNYLYGSKKLELGNINASRDWGYAGDYTRAMQMIIEADHPDEFVVSMDETRTVKDFLIVAFDSIGEKWEKFVEINKDLIRPNEVPYLHGKSDRVRIELGWKPEYTFEDLVEKMVGNDI